MSLRQSFHFLTYATALWAFLALAATGQIHLVAIILFLLFFALTVARHRFSFKLPPAWVWTIINIAIFMLALWGWFGVGERMYSVTYFFFYLEINKLLTAGKNRDYLQIYALTFFHMLAASVSTESVVFAPFLAVYVFLIIVSMIVFTIKRDAEAAFSPKRWKQKTQPFHPHRLSVNDEDVLRRLANEKFFDRRIGAWFGIVTIGVLILGSFIFWIVPRSERTNFIPGLSRGPSGPRTSGFTEDITFGGVGAIQTNPAIVMRASPYPEYMDDRPEFLRIRGTALDEYQGNKWVKSGFMRRQVIIDRRREFEFPSNGETREGGGELFKVRITLEPETSGYFFMVDQPILLDLNESMDMVIYREARSVKVNRRYQTISYDSTGFLPPANYEAPNAVSEDSLAPGANETAQGLPLLLKATMEELNDLSEQIRARAGRQNTSKEESEVAPVYLRFPNTSDMETVRRLADEWTAGLETDWEKAKEIERRLREDFDYSLESDYTGRDNHLTYFLTASKSGHCEYFATAMALMLRTQGIPSRIVNGYLTDEWSNTGKRYLIRQEHAHSWVEAVVEDSNAWRTFDPTPASGVGSNRIGNSFYHYLSSMLDNLRLLWYERFIDYNISDQREGFFAFLRFLYHGSRATESGMQSLSNFWIGSSSQRISGRKLMGLVFIAVALGMVAFVLLQAIRRKRPGNKSRRKSRRTDIHAVRPFLELMRELEKHYPRSPAQTPLDYARDVQEKVNGELDGLVTLTRGYYEVRYSGGTWSSALDELVLKIRSAMSTATTTAK